MTTSRELFRRIMHYEPVDRMPVWHWGGWEETKERWHNEGLPKDADPHPILNTEGLPRGLELNVGLLPPFEEKILEETAEYKIIRMADGVVAKHWKGRSCIPHYIDYVMKDRKGWPEYKKRLQPDRARRYPSNWPAVVKELNAYDKPVSVWCASMVGNIRDWTGVENFSYIMYDDRALLREMVETISDLVVETIEPALKEAKPDSGWFWEDICFRTGPLISPSVFKECVVPGYRKITNLLRKYGVDIAVVDCDGKIDDLIPLWLDAGVNTMFPVEIGAWQADPMAFRKKYGRNLRIIGGINKLEIAKGRKAIDAEIERRLPLMREGGYIPLPDHLLTPECSLDDYRYYLDRIRALRF